MSIGINKGMPSYADNRQGLHSLDWTLRPVLRPVFGLREGCYVWAVQA